MENCETLVLCFEFTKENKKGSGPAEIRTQDLRHVKATS